MGRPRGTELDHQIPSSQGDLLRKLIAYVMFHSNFRLWTLNTFCLHRFPYSRTCRQWNTIDFRIATLEFDRERKSMDFTVKSQSGKTSLLVKVIFELSHPQCFHL